MVDEAVDGGHGHGLVGKDLGPAGEGAVAGDDQAPVLVALGDEFEEDGGFGLVLAHISEVIEDQAIDAVELGEERRQGEVAPGSLETLNQVVGAQVEDAVPGLDQAVAQGSSDVALAGAAATRRT